MSLARRLQWGAAAILLAVALWAALAPLRYPTREVGFDFERSNSTLRTPAQVRLTLGVRDVLLLRNRDLAPHVFGQVRVLPGHVLRLPFEQEGDFPFACDTAPGTMVTVRVLAQPDPGWPRLRWRLQVLGDAIRTMPVRAPEA